MKLCKWLMVGIVILALALPLAGCVPKSQYETLQEENANLQEQNVSLQTELEEAQSNLASSQTRLEASQAELETAQTELASLQANYSELEAEKEAVAEELVGIKEVYPPRNFTSEMEMAEWLNETIAEGSEYLDRLLNLQNKALAKGYIVSISIDRDGKAVCVALIRKGSIYDTYWIWDDGYYEFIY